MPVPAPYSPERERWRTGMTIAVVVTLGLALVATLFISRRPQK